MNKEKGLKIAAWSLAAVVLGSALVYYNFIDKPIPSVEAGTLCPEFSVTVLDYENEAFAPRAETVSVSDYRGKILILNFWSTTCGSCMEEMPHFNEFQKAYADQVEILALDGETNLNQSQVISWMNKFRTTKGMEDRGAKSTRNINGTLLICRLAGTTYTTTTLARCLGLVITGPRPLFWIRTGLSSINTSARSNTRIWKVLLQECYNEKNKKPLGDVIRRAVFHIAHKRKTAESVKPTRLLVYCFKDR